MKKRNSERRCSVLGSGLLSAVLEHNNVFCLRAFLSLHNVELYPLAFFQIAVTTIVSEGAKMYENIRAFCTFNETGRVPRTMPSSPTPEPMRLR